MLAAKRNTEPRNSLKSKKGKHVASKPLYFTLVVLETYKVTTILKNHEKDNWTLESICIFMHVISKPSFHINLHCERKYPSQSTI